MPNESDHSAAKLAQLTKQVSLLENALKDERSAKKALEAKLDNVDQHRYDSYRELISALEQANNRQVQLKVLSNLANHHASSGSTAEMLVNFLKEISLLLEGATVLLFDYKNPKRAIAYLLEKDSNKLVKPYSNRIDITALLNQAANSSQTDDQLEPTEAGSSHWQRIAENSSLEPSLHDLFHHENQLVFSYQRLKQRKNLVVIDLPHYCYSKEVKQTLDTAGQQFVSAIQKRATEEKLAKNYQRLQRAVHKLSSVQHQLIHSEKMASIGQLAAGIAHEINNPIGYVKSNLSVLSDYITLFKKAINEARPHIAVDDELDFAKQDVAELISSCLDGVDRVAEIVSSLNSFARKEDSTKIAKVSLNQVLQESIKITWNNIKHTCEMVVELDENLPEVMGHKGELQQVFINLIVNALHAIEDSGKITVRSWFQDTVNVSVTDNGCGMDKTTQKKLFEPFYTTKPEGKGTGLGLSVSYAIIEHHRGKITVQSEIGKGTRFELKFPIAEQQLAQMNAYENKDLMASS
ncbi:sensor histidine kinase [Thalassotalea euphylliae]|uniref:histidine kinase n=1 Tax=Thalassotalea euphylliae TaxID=1655234 RepID=A0A3E0U4P7_9GAMM|nr:ATP-binding protein [Thalassotalea euphylliae]REL31971.1 hypothetical protein DXX94_15305 [Thalassotalea euphylliae]